MSVAEEIYKSVLQNKDSVTQLSNFVQLAENFNAKDTDYDVVKEYLQLSGNCQEIVHLVKHLPDSDSQNATLLMKTFCHILMRIASDLHIFSAAGNAIVNEILANGMKTVFGFLKPKQKSSRVKLALHLLSSMVALGKQAAHRVISKLDFSNVTFTQLLNKTNFSEEEDCRAAFINLIVLAITTCDNNDIRQIIEVKGFLNDVLPGLVSDRVSTITLVLSTFHNHIVENPSISKTSKLRLFNDYSLKPVLSLYTWKGPIQKKKSMKRKLGEDPQGVAYEVSEEEAERVHSCMHKFMLSLCCSHKFGIAFRDASVGTSGRNLNNVITSILKSFVKPYSNPLISDLIVSVLKACPDQMKFYLPCLKDSFIPRLSVFWFQTVTLTKKIIMSQEPITCLFKTDEKMPLTSLAMIAKMLCFPSLINLSEIQNVFTNEHHLLCHYLCDFITCILKQAKLIVDFCSHGNFSEIPYSASDMSVFRQSFLSSLFQNLNVMKELQTYWNRLTSGNESTPENNIDKDFPVPSLSAQLLKVLEIIKIFKELSLNFCQDFNLNLPALFSNLKRCSNFLTREELCRINIEIIDIVAKQGNESLVLWNKKMAESPLMIVFDMYLSSQDSQTISGISEVVYKVLFHTKIFDHCIWEIDVWLDAMKCAKKKHVPFIIEFINNTMHTLLQQSNKFNDEIIETFYSKVDSEQKNPSELLEDLLSDGQGNSVAANEKVEDILANQEQYFSCLVPAVVAAFPSLEDHKKKGCQLFVERTFTHILHRQYKPKLFLEIVNKYNSAISPGVYAYWELLCSCKQIKQSKESEFYPSESSMCESDLIDHLKYKFICTHALDNCSKPCLCVIKHIPQNLDIAYVRKVIWQTLTYINFELSVIEENDQKTEIMSYTSLLEKLWDYVKEFGEETDEIICDELSKKISDSDKRNESEKLEIAKEILNHPVILKLFLKSDLKKNNNSILKKCVIAVTKLVLNIVERLLHFYGKKCFSYIVAYKKKIVKFLILSVFNAEHNKKSFITKECDITTIIGIFSNVFSIEDVVIMLEQVLSLDDVIIQKIDSTFSVLLYLLKLYVEQEDFLLLSPNSVNCVFLKYISIPEKQKKICKASILTLLNRHPIFAYLVTEDSCLHLFQYCLSEDFPVLGMLLDLNNQFRSVIQTKICENMETMKDVDFLYLVSKCVKNFTMERNEQDEEFLKHIASSYWKIFSKFFTSMTLIPEISLLNECDFGKTIELLFREKFLSIRKLSKYFKLLEENDKSPTEMTIFVPLLKVWRSGLLENKKSDLPVLRLALLWYTSAVSSAANKNGLIDSNLQNFIVGILQDMSHINIQEVLEIDNFFPSMLKVGMKYEEIGREIIKIMDILCQKSDVSGLPVQTIYNLVTGHSNFFQIMLSEEAKNTSLKGYVIDFLITLVTLDKSVCKDNHLGLFLGSYGATMSAIDQKLLYLIKLYADSDVDMSKFSPFLWGKPAVIHYSVMNATSMYLWKQPKLQDVLSLLSSDMTENTILNYPLELQLQPCQQNMNNLLEEKVTGDTVYDLRFLLPLFAALLSPGAYIHCQSFVLSKSLMLLFTSLSSFDPNTRALGYYCISQFYQHLEGSFYGEKSIWLSLFDCVRNSISRPNPRIPSIISLFLAKVIDIFTKPDNNMYTILYKFIMVKPVFDIGNVPEFYVLFNSNEIEHREHRRWLLNILAKGLRTASDFHICKKRYIFSTLLSHYWSSICTHDEKVLIINIITAAVKTESSARSLCQNGLLSWLHNVIEQVAVIDAEIVKLSSFILKNLWHAVKSNSVADDDPTSAENLDSLDVKKGSTNDTNHKKIYSSFFYEFQLVLFCFLKKLNFLEGPSLNAYLSTFLHILNHMENSESYYVKYRLCLQHAIIIHEKWQECAENRNKNLQSGESSSESTNVHKCFEIFPKIILYWQPVWNGKDDQFLNLQSVCILKIFQLMLQFNDIQNDSSDSSFCENTVSKWLYKCFKEDKSLKLVRHFLSPEGENCVKLILKQFEKSLYVKESRDNEKENTCAILIQKEKEYWKKLLLQFKKALRNLDVDHSFHFLKQVCDIL